MRTSLLAALLCALAGCPAPPSGAGGADLAQAPDLGAASCGEEDGEPGGECVLGVSGQVVDDRGAAIPDLTVTVCAAQCFFGETGANGRFRVQVGRRIRAADYALLIHGQPRWSAYYAPLPPLSQGEGVMAAPLPLLPMPTEGPEIKRDGSAQSLRAGGVTLTLAAGTDVFLSSEDAREIELGGRLRPLRVPTDRPLPFLVGQPAPLAVYAFGPFEATFSKKAGLSLPNDTGLGKGEKVTVWRQRGLLSGAPPAAGLDLVGDAQVSEDGARIELTGGVLALTWLIVRKP